MNFFQEQLILISTQFHWLRPAWLLALIPIIFLVILLWRQKHHAHQWQHLIAPELLPFLLDGKTITTKKSLLWGLILAWLISTIALAGSSWIKRATPVEKNQQALVILLDLSISMFSEDVKPSRIVRARLKIADILSERKDGQTALVVYAGEAHTVTPLSDDNATIISLLPALQPSIMPLQGSNTEAAIERGIQLLHDAGATQGDLLLITDGVVPAAFAKINALLSDNKIHLKILGVGTNQPAPIASGSGGFLRDNQGAIITTQLNSSELNTLANQVHGRYSDIANTRNDIDSLLPQAEKDDKNKPTLERDFDQWFDQGYWLVFLLLPIVLFSFRRGFILMLFCVPLLSLTPSPTYAVDLGGLSNMWSTKDQQAKYALANGDAKKAAEQFEKPDWKASAQYRAGDYAAAAESFAKSDTATAHYNRGNALAKAGKLEDAIKAYDEALTRDAALADAKKNRVLVETLLKQQQKDKKDENKDSDNKDSKDKKDNQDKDKKNEQEQKDAKDQKEAKDSQEQNSDEEKSQEEKSQEQKQQEKEQKDSSAQNANQQNPASSTANQQASAAAAQGQTSSAATSENSQQAAQTSSQSSGANTADAKNPSAMLDQNNLTEEQQQALEQWLRRVPDDPGGLLRNKFKYQYLQNRQKKANGEFESPKNNADQRW